MRVRIFILIFTVQCVESVFSQQNINKNLFGFCTSNSFTYVDTYDTSFISKVKQISPKVLRFPGGTIGNFYHPKKEAYGFKVSDVESCYDGRFSNRVHVLKQAASKRGHTADYLEDFIALARRFNAKVIVNANILSSDKSEIVYVLKRFEDQRIEVLGVELGSELCNRAYKNKIKSVDDYIELSKSYAQHIKHNFPRMKVGVVAAPIKNKIPNRIKNWNNRLAKENFYDAVIYHAYHKVVDGEADAGVMITEYSVNESKKEQFDLYKERILVELNSNFAKRIHQYNSIFKNKEIWITEWNMQMTRTTGNTMLQSMFVAQFMLDLLSEQKLGNIKIATYHNLAGRDLSGSIYRGVGDGFETHSTHIPFSFIGEIFNYEILRINKSVSDSENTFLYSCYNIYDELVLSYLISWDNSKSGYYQLIFNNFYKEESKIFKSKNLFNVADSNGNINLLEVVKHE